MTQNALLQHQLVIFVISTTGQGDMPHNSLVFWKKLLRKKLPPNCLSRLKYTCFGLGDSTYLKYDHHLMTLHSLMVMLVHFVPSNTNMSAY